MEESSNRLYVQLFTQPLDIDWPREGDELMHHMWAVLGDLVPMEGHSYIQHRPTAEEPVLYFGWSPMSKVLKSDLCVVPTDAGVHVYVRVEDPDQIPDQVQPWADAIIEAAKRLNAGHPEHEWWAVIGPGPSMRAQAYALAEATEIGGMIIGTASSPFFDSSLLGVPSLYGYGVYWSYPVIVSGTAHGYDWPTASELAARNLNRLCAIVSLALNQYWTVLHAPQTHRIEADHLPKARYRQLEERPAETNLQRDETRLPNWCSKTWDLIEADEIWATSLHAYHQGLALEDTFPSFALIAYVSAIEGIGAKLEDLRRCDCCEKCSCTVGAGRRFRQALRLVLPSTEAKLLAQAYERRSKTAHEGRLHGDELTLGSSHHFRVFAPTPAADDFRYREVRQLREASNRLLRHYLTAAKPELR